MDRKSYISLFAFVLFTAVSCQKGPLDEPASGTSLSEGAVSFDAYVSIPTTKGPDISKDSVRNGGFGVFAFYQASVMNNPVPFNTRKFTTPDYMYNQQVTYYGSSWTYEPVKFWPNSEGDRLSFFGYAPYRPDRRWEDLGISTSTSSDKLFVTFSINDNILTQEDILWATPQINRSNKTSERVGVTVMTIPFKFQHITSKVELLVGVATAPYADEWSDSNTVIIPRSIVFEDLNRQFKYTYSIENDVLVEPAKVDYINDRTFNLTVEPGEDADTISVRNWKWNRNGGILVDSLKGYHPFVQADQYVFVSQQEFSDQTVSITYTVKTTDPYNKQNNSIITNTVSRKLADILPLIDGTESHGFQAGKAYRMKFLIGMDEVDVSADLIDWETSTHQIDVPGNLCISVTSDDESLWKVSNVTSTGSGCARSGEILSFDVEVLDTVQFQCCPDPGKSVSCDAIPEKPSSESDMTPGKMYKSENGKVYTIYYKVPDVNSATSITVSKYLLRIVIEPSVENQWIISEVTCSGSGEGKAGEKISFIVTKGSATSNSFILKGGKDTLVREIAAVVPGSNSAFKVEYTILETGKPDTIRTASYNLLLSDRAADPSQWSVDGQILCSGTGTCRVGEKAVFLTQNVNGQDVRCTIDNQEITVTKEPVTVSSFRQSGLFGLPRGKFKVTYTLPAAVTAQKEINVENFIPVARRDDKWSITDIKCSKDGKASTYHPADTVHFTLTANSGATVYEIINSKGDILPFEADTTASGHNIRLAIPSAAPDSILVYDTKTPAKVTCDTNWTFSNLACSGTGSALTGETVTFTVTAKGSQAGQHCFYLTDGNAARTGYSITERVSGGVFDVSYEVQAGDTRPIRINVVTAPVRVLSSNSSNWTVSKIACDGTHTYTAGENLTFTVTSKGSNKYKLQKSTDGTVFSDMTKGTDYTDTGGSISYPVPSTGKASVIKVVLDPTQISGGVDVDDWEDAEEEIL